MVGLLRGSTFDEDSRRASALSCALHGLLHLKLQCRAVNILEFRCLRLGQCRTLEVCLGQLFVTSGSRMSSRLHVWAQLRAVDSKLIEVNILLLLAFAGHYLGAAGAPLGRSCVVSIRFAHRSPLIEERSLRL